MHLRKLFALAVVFALTFGAVWVVTTARGFTTRPEQVPWLVEHTAMPHHVPPFAGGAAFRFAMAHDVIHERFARHGQLHYQERNRLTREQLAALDAGDPARFPLIDDLAVGLDRLGQPADGIPLLREKLARQQAQGLTGRALYTSYANLGTLLIHANFRSAQAGDAQARESFREGVELIHKSVEVNPEAHFGREKWQAAIAEFILAALDDPDLLKTWDCIGNKLSLDVEVILHREAYWVEPGYGRATTAKYSQRPDERMLPSAEGKIDDPARWEALQTVRESITRVGAESGWKNVPVSSHQQQVPFDEPMLGMIGMWRQGGGANPHFALAFGETMLRTGQRYIAWAAYERAHDLADRYWPDPELQTFLREHCRRRQQQIEQTLLAVRQDLDRAMWQHVSPPPAPDEVAQLRQRFAAELAHGQRFQQEHQQYEARKIAAGVPITEASFFDEFYAGRGPIASHSGSEEWFAYVSKEQISHYTRQRALGRGLFWGGAAAFAVALCMRVAAWRRADRKTQPANQTPGVITPDAT